MRCIELRDAHPVGSDVWLNLMAEEEGEAPGFMTGGKPLCKTYLVEFIPRPAADAPSMRAPPPGPLATAPAGAAADSLAAAGAARAAAAEELRSARRQAENRAAAASLLGLGL